MQNKDVNKGSKENELSKKLLDAEFEELFKGVDDKSHNLNNEDKKQDSIDEISLNDKFIEHSSKGKNLEINKNESTVDYELDEFVADHLLYLEQKKEAKEKKYYVEPVEQFKDFSEHGDLADIAQAAHENEYREYLKKVQDMKKKRAEDEKREKIDERIKRMDKAQQENRLKLDRKITRLDNKVKKLHINGRVVGFNDANKWIKLEVPRVYHKVIDHSGKVITAAEFVEISQRNPAFYIYDNMSKTYKFFASFSENSIDYKMLLETQSQKEIWDFIKKGGSIDNMGFLFREHKPY
jgi:hypothetical protein